MQKPCRPLVNIGILSEQICFKVPKCSCSAIVDSSPLIPFTHPCTADSGKSAARAISCNGVERKQCFFSQLKPFHLKYVTFFSSLFYLCYAANSNTVNQCSIKHTSMQNYVEVYCKVVYTPQEYIKIQGGQQNSNILGFYIPSTQRMKPSATHRRNRVNITASTLAHPLVHLLRVYVCIHTYRSLSKSERQTEQGGDHATASVSRRVSTRRNGEVSEVMIASQPLDLNFVPLALELICLYLC